MWMKIRKILTWNHKLYPELASPEQFAHVGADCANLIIELPTQRKVVTELWTDGRRCGKLWEINEPLVTHFHSRSSVSCWFEAMSHWPHTHQTLKRLTASNVGSVGWNCNYFTMNALMKFILEVCGDGSETVTVSSSDTSVDMLCTTAGNLSSSYSYFLFLCEISFNKGKKWY